MSDWTLVLGIGGDGTFLVGKVGDLIEKVNQGADVKIRYQDDPATWWVRETSSAVVDANNRVTAVAEGLATSDLETIAYPYTPDQTRSCQRYDFFSSFGYMMSSDTFGKVDDWPMDPDPPRAVHMQWFARDWYEPRIHIGSGPKA